MISQKNSDGPSFSGRSMIIPACLSAVVWWIAPLILWINPRSSGEQGGFTLFAFGILALAVSAVVCSANRTKKWCVLFWMPPASISLAASLYWCFQFYQEASSLKGYAAPLEGVAVWLMLGLLALLLGPTLLLLFLRPCSFPRIFTIIALLNSAAIGLVGSKVDYLANKQEVTIHILDFDGHPIEGAILKYERIGYGAGGKDVPAGRGVPISSDAQGIVRPHMRPMRNEMRGIIQHPQYQPVAFTLGMQFSKWDLARSFSLGTERGSPSASGSISIKRPLSAYVYLPLRVGTANSTKPKTPKISTILTPDQFSKSHLDLEACSFVNSPEGDLLFELYFEPDGQYERARLRIQALQGTGIQMLEPYVSFSEPIPLPERLFDIAPLTEYKKQITIMSPGNIPGPKVFVSTKDNSKFYCLSVELWADYRTKTGRCVVNIVRNLNGTRDLEANLVP